MPERHSDADHSSPTAAAPTASSNAEGSPRPADATLPETADRTLLPGSAALDGPSTADSSPRGPSAAGPSTAGPSTAGLPTEGRPAGGVASDSSGSDGFASGALTPHGSNDAGRSAGGVRSGITADAVLTGRFISIDGVTAESKAVME